MPLPRNYRAGFNWPITMKYGLRAFKKDETSGPKEESGKLFIFLLNYLILNFFQKSNTDPICKYEKKIFFLYQLY